MNLVDVVLVLDNAPCHSRIEEILIEDQYRAASILRLGPYSPMLNPIEIVFSAFKSRVKAFFARSRRDIVRTPEGMMQIAHMSLHLVDAAKRYFTLSATPDLCQACAAHTLKFHAAILTLQNVAVRE